MDSRGSGHNCYNSTRSGSGSSAPVRVQSHINSKLITSMVPVYHAIAGGGDTVQYLIAKWLRLQYWCQCACTGAGCCPGGAHCEPNGWEAN